MMRRLPRRFRPLPRRTISFLLTFAAAAMVVAGLRLSAPVGPVLAAGPVLGLGALERRDVEVVSPHFWIYPERHPAQEGWLTVPGDHGDPRSRRLRVHYTRLEALPAAPEGQQAPAGDALPPVGGPSDVPIVYLADSAQGSATAALVGRDFATLQALRRLGPLIAFDGRDSLDADPSPQCPGNWSVPDGVPLGRELVRRTHAEAVRLCGAALQQHFGDVRFGIEQSVADLEALRDSLGIERVRLLATGDGTRLALSYLAAHPERVERAVLLGAQDPRHTAPRPEHVENALSRALAALREDPEWRRRLPEPRESLRVAIARLDHQPVRQSARDPLTGRRTAVTLGGADLRVAVYEQLARRDGLVALARLLDEVFHGRYERLADSALALRRAPPPRAAWLAQRCLVAEDATRARRERLAAAFTLLGDAADLVRAAHCASWPQRPAPTRWNAPLDAPPVLLVAGDYDAAAPLEQAQVLAETLAGARVLRASDAVPGAYLQWAMAGSLGGDVHGFLAGHGEPASGLLAGSVAARAAQ